MATTEQLEQKLIDTISQAGDCKIEIEATELEMLITKIASERKARETAQAELQEAVRLIKVLNGRLDAYWNSRTKSDVLVRAIQSAQQECEPFCNKHS